MQPRAAVPAPNPLMLIRARPPGAGSALSPKAAAIWIASIAAAAPLCADPATEPAEQLYHAHRYAEAKAALEPIVQSEPNNAEACYYLGKSILKAGGADAKDEALPWLEKARDLAPQSEAYLADYAGVCLELADVHRSYRYAIEGRNSMEKAISLNPGDLEGRNGLVQFYARAPWPLGDKDKAFDEASEIAKRNSARGVQAYLWLGRLFDRKKDSNRSRRAYDEVLKLDPGNASAAAALAQSG